MGDGDFISQLREMKETGTPKVYLMYGDNIQWRKWVRYLSAIGYEPPAYVTKGSVGSIVCNRISAYDLICLIDRFEVGNESIFIEPSGGQIKPAASAARS